MHSTAAADEVLSDGERIRFFNATGKCEYYNMVKNNFI